MTEHESSGAVAKAFGRSSRRRMLWLYLGAVGPCIAIIYGVLRVGGALHAPAGARPATVSGTVAGAAGLWKILIAVAVIIVASRAVGIAFSKINQPQVMGEVVAGVILGPSLLGNLWPAGSTFLFPPTVLPYIEVMAQIGLILFMFLVGVELDVRLLRGSGEAAATVSHISIVVPFLSGVLLALGLFSRLGPPGGRFLPFALFLGASMSVTAFPVLARILNERDLDQTRLGAVALTCAAVDDVTAWCLLAVVLALSAGAGLTRAAVTISLSVAFSAFMIGAIRPVLAQFAAHAEERGEVSAAMLTMLIAGLMLSAVATDRIGIHAMFGAFLFGAIMPQRSLFIRDLTGKLEHFVLVFLLPLFFAYSGLRTNLWTLGTDPVLWLICGIIVFTAVVGKWGGSTIAARVAGFGWREANGLGILMNCRGLTELVILNIGLDLGVISSTLFAMLVIMAVVTTFVTTPALAALFPLSGAHSSLRNYAGTAPTEPSERPSPPLEHGQERGSARNTIEVASLLDVSHVRQLSGGRRLNFRAGKPRRYPN